MCSLQFHPFHEPQVTCFLFSCHPCGQCPVWFISILGVPIDGIPIIVPFSELESQWAREKFWGAVLCRFRNPREEWDIVGTESLREDCRLQEGRGVIFKSQGKPWGCLAQCFPHWPSCHLVSLRPSPLPHHLLLASSWLWLCSLSKVSHCKAVSEELIQLATLFYPLGDLPPVPDLTPRLTLQVGPWNCHTFHWLSALVQLSTEVVHDSWLLFDLTGSKILVVTSLFHSGANGILYNIHWENFPRIKYQKFSNIKPFGSWYHKAIQCKNLGISFLMSHIIPFKELKKKFFLNLQKLGVPVRLT